MSVWQQKSQQQLRLVSIGFHRGNEMNKVWLHFIGGYYQIIERFINEKTIISISNYKKA
jgi:hypothetical protein